MEGPWRFGAQWSPERVAVLAHWSAHPQVSRSVATLVRQLVRADFDVLVVSTCEAPEALQWPAGMPPRLAVMRRSNAGYDFGSWAVALARFPQIVTAAQVLLVNDSMLGPFRDIGQLLQEAELCGADVCGLTDSAAVRDHLQSYFLWFHRGVLDSDALRDFWSDIRVQPSKEVVVRQYEIGLSLLLARHGYSTHALYPYAGVVPRGQDPTVHGWRALLEAGFPFLKRIVLRHPDAPQRAQAAEVIRALYGLELDDWL